jgi:hypothetical protein
LSYSTSGENTFGRKIAREAIGHKVFASKSTVYTSDLKISPEGKNLKTWIIC